MIFFRDRVRSATMFRVAVILCAIAVQVHSEPKPRIESYTTNHTEQTQHSLAQQNSSILDQPHQRAKSQLNSLDHSHKENRTDGGAAQTVEEYGQIVTGPSHVDNLVLENQQSVLNSQSLVEAPSNPRNFGQQSEDLSPRQLSGLGNYTQRTSKNVQFGHQHQEHTGKLEFGLQYNNNLTQQIDDTTQRLDDLSRKRTIRNSIASPKRSILNRIKLPKIHLPRPKPRPKPKPMPRPKPPPKLRPKPQKKPKVKISEYVEDAKDLIEQVSSNIADSKKEEDEHEDEDEDEHEDENELEDEHEDEPKDEDACNVEGDDNGTCEVNEDVDENEEVDESGDESVIQLKCDCRCRSPTP